MGEPTKEQIEMLRAWARLQVSAERAGEWTSGLSGAAILLLCDAYEERGQEVELLKNSAPEIVSALGEERTARKQAEAEVERLRAEVQNDYKALWEADSKKLEQAEASLREVVDLARRLAADLQQHYGFYDSELLAEARAALAAAQPEEES